MGRWACAPQRAGPGVVGGVAVWCEGWLLGSAPLRSACDHFEIKHGLSIVLGWPPLRSGCDQFRDMGTRYHVLTPPEVLRLLSLSKVRIVMCLKLRRRGRERCHSVNLPKEGMAESAHLQLGQLNRSEG